LVKLKAKIVNFDIKPQQSIINDLSARVDVALEQNDYQLAEKILYKILACNNANTNALSKLLALKSLCKDFNASVKLLRQLLHHEPNNLSWYWVLSDLYYHMGKRLSYIKTLKKIIKLAPEDESAKHLLASVNKEKTNIAPRQYIVDLFNNYAKNFETTLLNDLQYRAHMHLAEYIDKTIRVDFSLDTVLDLGCGTGLLGQELIKTKTIKNLVGIDIAERMLEQCHEKNIYHALHESDMLDYLRDTNVVADLIVSSDALIYVGNLEPLFACVYQCLRIGGYFGFTIEKRAFGSYSLDLSGRYRHSIGYIKSLYKKYQFSKIYSQTIDLRLESGNMVQGYLVLLQK